MSALCRVILTSAGIAWLGGSTASATAAQTVTEPIVVTATRTAQTADATLASVQVITREQIEQAQASDVAQLLRFQAGLDIAQRILQTDVLLEAAHRLILQAYAALHDPAGMARQYQQYQEALADQLGLQPSSEITSLYEHLLREI